MLNTKPKPGFAKPILLRPTAVVRNEIVSLANAEKRSITAQSLVLIEEALAARKEPAKRQS